MQVLTIAKKTSSLILQKKKNLFILTQLLHAPLKDCVLTVRHEIRSPGPQGRADCTSTQTTFGCFSFSVNTSTERMDGLSRASLWNQPLLSSNHHLHFISSTYIKWVWDAPVSFCGGDNGNWNTSLFFKDKRSQLLELFQEVKRKDFRQSNSTLSDYIFLSQIPPKTWICHLEMN